jgi:hypothetical protein
VRGLAALYHVDYLIVDSRDFGPEAKPRSKYLEPWTTVAANLIARGPVQQLFFADPPRDAVVFTDGPTLVIDLHKI